METTGRKELMYKEVGKYCLDLSKLVFGGVILAGVMDLGFDLIPLILVGLGFVFVFGAMGMFAMFMSNTKNRSYGTCVFLGNFSCDRHYNVYLYAGGLP